MFKSSFFRIQLFLFILIDLNLKLQNNLQFSVNSITVNHLKQCPSMCKCSVEIKERTKDLIDTNEMMKDTNFKVRTICHKRQIHNLSITSSISYLSVQL